MLFNSIEFVLFFLPLTLLIYSFLRIWDKPFYAKSFLVLASVIFYGWWKPIYVPLICGSIILNYLGSLLYHRGEKIAKITLITGIVLNLGLLGYFKYFNFFLGNASQLFGGDFKGAHIALPLAISFFTFQQIAYLIEAYRDRKAADSFLDYSLFVLFFPHLIAGPITHHKEMLPQFKEAGHGVIQPVYFSVGLTIFILGLAKKTLLADTAALYADPFFDAAAAGQILTATAAWIGSLAYTFQLYFDFSGYSDMAIGLGLLFGIRLPVNFASPYKATSIIDFWRRWHISLSRFLRNYLYFPMGGNRCGTSRRYVNLLLTMTIGGLWHGAGWTFAVWGALHGCYLVINHVLRRVVVVDNRMTKFAGWLLTFGAVVIGWVFFRATSFSSAVAIVKAMATGVVTQADAYGVVVSTPPVQAFFVVVVCAAIAFFSPSALEVVGYPKCIPEADGVETAPLSPIVWKWTGGACVVGGIAAFVLAKLPDPGVFLYFNF